MLQVHWLGASELRERVNENITSLLSVLTAVMLVMAEMFNTTHATINMSPLRLKLSATAFMNTSPHSSQDYWNSLVIWD